MSRLVIDASFGGEPARLEFEPKLFGRPRFASESPGVRVNLWAKDGHRLITISADEFAKLVAAAPHLEKATRESWAAAAISKPPEVKP